MLKVIDSLQIFIEYQICFSLLELSPSIRKTYCQNELLCKRQDVPKCERNRRAIQLGQKHIHLNRKRKQNYCNKHVNIFF